jgi:hypothetical protein
MMSALAVTAERDLSSTTLLVHPESVMQRARRALVMSGMTALIVGAILGLIQADPSILISRLGYQPHPTTVALIGGGAIGLVGGLISGLALRGRTGLLRWVVAMFALIVGLIVSEMVYGVSLGMSLNEALRVMRDDVEAAEIGVGAAMALLGSLVGWQKTQRTRPANTRAIVAPAAATPVIGWRRLHRPASSSSATAGQSRSSRRSVRGRSTPQVELTTPSAPVKPAARSKRKSLRRRHVQLGKQSTSVCPYCLEEVLPRDPRGKVVCDICGTPHHGDCWAITGKCEVPHLQM